MTDVGFAARLRAATRAEHEEAERSAYVAALVDGRLARSGFAALTAQLYFVYSGLERAAATLRDHPTAGAFVMDELLRVPALEQDLGFLVGPGWRAEIAARPATRRYVERLEQVAREWPAGFVAHHYTRYLGDLSGGQIIGRLARRLYDLGDDGVRFYFFADVPKPKLFKDRYRELLDQTQWSESEEDRVIAEAKLAFRLNTAVFADLGKDLDRYLAA